MRKLFLVATTALCLVTAPHPAYSAPLAGIIGAALGGLGTVGTALLGTALSIGANWLIQKIFAEEPKPQGVKQRMESGGDNPVSFIVGKYATPGKLVYVNSYGEDAKGLIMVVNLSEIPVDSLSSKVVINGKTCDINFGDLDDDGFAKVNQYQEDGHNFCSMKFYNDPGSAPDFLRDTFGSDPVKPWDNDMIGTGCSYVIVYCRFSTDGVWSGIPTFKFIVKGIPLYDPRKDSTVGGSGSHRWGHLNTYEWTENCYVISYNVIRGIYYDDKKVFGGNAREEQLPLDIWVAAMNTCDENVSLKHGGSIDRFTMGAEISVDIAPLDILREIDNSTSGYTFEFGGIWKAFCGSPGASVVTITDEDILISSEQMDDLFKPLQETYNVAQASYPEPDACWEQKDAPTRYFDDLIEEDGGEELSINMEFPYVYQRNQVQRLMRAAIMDSRRQRVHSIELPPPFAKFEPYDVITWESVRNGYDNKKFLILQKDDMPNCNQLMLIREINPDDYDWDTIMELDDSVGPTTDTPDVTDRDFTVVADYIDRPAVGKDKPAIKATWDWGEDNLNIRTIRWRIRRAGKVQIIARGDFDNYADGEEIFTHRVLRFGQDYQVQFRIEPRGQKRSPWGDWKDVTMLAADIPTGLTLTAQSRLNGDGHLRFWVKANWTEVDQDHNGYGVKITVDGVEDYRRVDGSQYKFAVDAPSDVTVAVRTRSGDGGTPGAYCTPVNISVTKKATAPTTPTGFTASGKHRRAVLKIDTHPDEDFKRWNVYFSKTNNFGTGTKSRHSKNDRAILDDLDNNDTYYLWVTAEDTSGNESAKWPSSSTAGIQINTKPIEDDDTSDNLRTAPTGLTATKIQEKDEEGTIRTYLELDCTPPGWAGDKVDFIYEITVTGISKKYREIGDNGKAARFKVNKTGVLHSIRVRAKAGVGDLSSWTSAVTITPSKKSADASAVTGVGSHRKNGNNVVKWNAITDPDNREVIIKRATSNVYAAATEIGRTKGTRFVDTDINTDGVTYYYFIDPVDTSGNVGTSSTSTSQTESGIGTSDTDATVLAAPTGISLTQANRDVDQDGTVDIALRTTFSGGVALAAGYEVWWEDNAGQSASVRADSGSFWFVANTTRTYRVRWRTINWVGTPGSWSSYTSYVAPSPASGAPATPTSITATPNPLGFQATWTAPTALDYMYSQVGVGSSGSVGVILATATSNNAFLNYSSNFSTYIWVRHFNTSGLSSAWARSASAYTSDPVNSWDIAANSIGKTQLVGGEAAASARTNLGTSLGGSVNAGGGTSTVLLLEWKCTSTTAGVTVTLGSKSQTFDFIDQAPFTMISRESGGGSFSSSKSGGGTLSGAELVAITLY